MICYCRPQIIHLDNEYYTLRIPLNWRTRNHVQSMYIGVFTVGADLTRGLLTLSSIRKRKRKVVLIFKIFMQISLREQNRMLFSFVRMVQQLIMQSSRRWIKANGSIYRSNITAMLSQDTEDDPVANFRLTLSMKDRTNA